MSGLEDPNVYSPQEVQSLWNRPESRLLRMVQELSSKECKSFLAFLVCRLRPNCGWIGWYGYLAGFIPITRLPRSEDRL